MFNLYQQQINIPSMIKIGSGEMNFLGQHLMQAGFSKVGCFISYGLNDQFCNTVHHSLLENNIELKLCKVIDNTSIENIVNDAFKLDKDLDVLIGIGGGKAIDYSKYCAHILGLPFISIPTSVSNDGFCSPFSSLLCENKRQTVISNMPYGVIVDTKVVSSSPDSLIYSGIGDIISKVTSGFDWKEANKRNLAKFNDFAYLISQNTLNDFFDCNIATIKSEKFIRSIVNSLIMSGLSMEIACSSRPASGSEHLISHALDRIAINPKLHGLQVGLATYICSYLQENAFENVKTFLTSVGFLDFLVNEPFDKQELIQAVKIAPQIKQNYYTILSEIGMIEKAIEFINSDPVIQTVLI